ncbi:TPA: LPXTG cell wall anchor domain-containing protein, partial [Streptococcus suis]
VDDTPVTPIEESTPVDDTPVTPTEESTPVVEIPASSSEESTRVEETSAPPTEVVPSVTENSSIPTKVDKLVSEAPLQLTKENTHNEDLSSATTVSGQKVETEKTSAPTLPRTNGHQSKLPILAGLALLSLTVAKRKKDFLG